MGDITANYLLNKLNSVNLGKQAANLKTEWLAAATTGCFYFCLLVRK